MSEIINNNQILDNEDAPLVANFIFNQVDRSGKGYFDDNDLNEVERMMSENFKTLAYQRDSKSFARVLKNRLDYNKDGKITFEDILVFVQEFMCGEGSITEFKLRNIPDFRHYNNGPNLEEFNKEMEDLRWIDEIFHKHKSQTQTSSNTQPEYIEEPVESEYTHHSVAENQEESPTKEIEDNEEEDDYHLFERENRHIHEMPEDTEYGTEYTGEENEVYEEGPSEFRSPTTCRSPITEYTEDYSEYTVTPRSEIHSTYLRSNREEQLKKKILASGSTFNNTDEKSEAEKLRREALEKIRESQKPKFEEASKERDYATHLFFKFDTGRKGYILVGALQEIITQAFKVIGINFMPSVEDVQYCLGERPFDENSKIYKSEFEDVIVKSLKLKGIKFV